MPSLVICNYYRSFILNYKGTDEEILKARDEIVEINNCRKKIRFDDDEIFRMIIKIKNHMDTISEGIFKRKQELQKIADDILNELVAEVEKYYVNVIFHDMEMVEYEGEMSDRDIQDITTYFKNKYNLHIEGDFDE